MLIVKSLQFWRTSWWPHLFCSRQSNVHYPTLSGPTPQLDFQVGTTVQVNGIIFCLSSSVFSKTLFPIRVLKILITFPGWPHTDQQSLSGGNEPRNVFSNRRVIIKLSTGNFIYSELWTSFGENWAILWGGTTFILSKDTLIIKSEWDKQFSSKCSRKIKILRLTLSRDTLSCSKGVWWPHIIDSSVVFVVLGKI